MVTDIGNITASDSTALLKMWEVTVPSGQRPLRQHSHIYFEITLVEDGGGTYTVGEREYSMNKGDLFVFASNEHHCITNVAQGGLKLVNLHFEPRYLWGNSADSLSEESINLCFSHNKDFENLICEDRAERLRGFITKIKEELICQEKEYSLTVKSLLNLFLVALVRDFNYADKSVSLSREGLHSIRRVIKYIDQNLSGELTLSDLAQLAQMSPNYFSTFFHNISGITLWDYINSRRIDMATHLILEDNDRNMLDIALLCGFNNTANFNKIFKKFTGLTPSQYRHSGDILTGGI